MNYFKSQSKSSKNSEITAEKIDETFVHKNLLNIIFICSPKENLKARPFFMNFIAKIATIGKFKLEFSLCFNSALFLLENSTNELLGEEYNEEKSKLILNLLKLWESDLLSRNINKLIEAAEISPLYEL